MMSCKRMEDMFMTVDWKDAGDVGQLELLVKNESSAKQRDRYRVVLLAGQGQMDKDRLLTREQIAQQVARSRQFVDEWVGRYRDGGMAALLPRKQKGAVPKLTSEQQAQLCKMLDAGPAKEEGLAAYNGPILREKIQSHFGQLYSLSGLYALLHRLKYNDLMPRTTHPDTDPAVQEDFKKTSCLSG
jgi:transposase